MAVLAVRGRVPVLLSPDHITTGVGTTADGRPIAIGVETFGDALMIHHFVGEVTEPHHCRMVSTSEAVAAEGRTTVEVIWELRAEPTADGRCTVTDRIAVLPTGDYFAFLDHHGITFEDAAAACDAACNDHNRRETPLLAASIARRATTSNGRHSITPVAAVTIRRETAPADEAAKAVVRRNTEQVQGGGDFAVFDELFADDFVDHTRNRASPRTRPARGCCTSRCGPRSRTSTPTSTGSRWTATW
ncbi:hypothetical protein P9209_13490 [Prescottella defluvii]|nr:hypothetical protein P9209_13490 [Prescottella defluvii]